MWCDWHFAPFPMSTHRCGGVLECGRARPICMATLWFVRWLLVAVECRLGFDARARLVAVEGGWRLAMDSLALPFVGRVLCVLVMRDACCARLSL
jgi:hypothetical protein